MDDLIKRINELAKKKKSEGLTEAEQNEQNELRQKYLKSFRGNLKESLLNSKVVDPEGNDVTPQKLKDAKEKLQNNPFPKEEEK